MFRASSFLLFLILSCLVALGFRQAGETISGGVYRADSRVPVPLVRVELVREEYARRPSSYDKVCQPHSETEPSDLRSFATTDFNGRFTFRDIAPGRYRLAAEREGYLRAEYGQRSRFPIGTVLKIGRQEEVVTVARGTPPAVLNTIESTPATVLQDLRLFMYPAPTIFGRAFDEKGKPVPAGIVQVYQMRYVAIGGRTLKAVRAALTNDRGDYRVFWLDPGRYNVSAGYTEYGLQPLKAGLQFTPNLASPDAGYPTTFYPGVPNAATAVPVLLTAGSEAAADFTVRDRPRFNVKAQLVGAGPPDASLVFIPYGGDLCTSPDYAIRTKGGGAFEVRDVPEGLYVAMAMDGRIVISELATVRVDARSANEVQLAVVPPVSIRGHVTFNQAPQGVDLRSIRASLTRTGLEVSQLATATLEPDGEFLIKGPGPGAYFPTLDLPQGFFVSSVLATKRPVNSENPTCKPGPPPDRQGPALPGAGGIAPSGFVPNRNYAYLDNHGHLDASRPLRVPSIFTEAANCLLITVDSGGQIVGRVDDRVRNPVAGALVVGLPRSAWTKPADGGFTPPDRFLFATTDETGWFRLRGVPTGLLDEYRLYAFEDLDPNMIYDPEFGDRFVNRHIFVLLEDLVRRLGTQQFARHTTCPTTNLACILTVIPASDTQAGTR